MKTYRRSLWILFKGLLMAPCAAVLLYFILNIFTTSKLILYGIPSLAFLLLLYIVIFSENIRFELDDTGILRYFKRGKLKKTYVLEEYLFGYRSRSDSTSTDVTLNILHIESNTEESIDCSPIGPRQFSDMYDRVKSYTKEEPEVLKA